MSDYPLQKLPNETIQAIADAELEKHGLAQKGWTHSLIDEGPRNRMGYCSSAKKQIVSNSHYIKYGLCAEQIVDTIRHEIAHALDGGARYSRGGRRMVHDARWRMLAMHVGANPRATGDMTGYEAPASAIPVTKWMMVLIDKDYTLTEIRPVKRFLKDMDRRYISNRGKKRTLGNLYLVLTSHWKAYKEGRMAAHRLEFWQDNPNDRIWPATPFKLPR